MYSAPAKMAAETAVSGSRTVPAPRTIASPTSLADTWQITSMAPGTMKVTSIAGDAPEREGLYDFHEQFAHLGPDHCDDTAMENACERSIAARPS